MEHQIMMRKSMFCLPVVVKVIGWFYSTCVHLDSNIYPYSETINFPPIEASIDLI